MLYDKHEKEQFTPEPQRGTESINYIFLPRGQKYMNCHDGLFWFSGPLDKFNCVRRRRINLCEL